MPDRLWTARFRSKPGFATFTERLMPWLVGFAGLMSSLFLYLIARGAARWRQQAVLLERAQRDVESAAQAKRSEEHTSELQSLMRNSYAVFCLKKKKKMINQ